MTLIRKVFANHGGLQCGLASAAGNRAPGHGSLSTIGT